MDAEGDPRPPVGRRPTGSFPPFDGGRALPAQVAHPRLGRKRRSRRRPGPRFTSAALLTVVVFAGLAAGEVLSIEQLGFGLALAVIVDATIVRSLLVPATPPQQA